MSSRGIDVSSGFSELSDVLACVAEGKIFILVDDEDRENEGDLVIPADLVTAEHINFMLKFGRGIVCLSISDVYAKKLKLDPLPQRNNVAGCTFFLTPIDLKNGISTGVSASDRAATIRAVTDESFTVDDFVTPGHIFPVLAVDGGVKNRRGHTEASVDMSVLAGYSPAAVICEIMNDDGSMARRPDLLAFSKKHEVKITTISKLVEHLQTLSQ